ncbi:hypothetical protein F2Q70_00019464 [Brassica cretica]|uniref:Uncharacterized protein n=1 Tax=Brassica cretica TaxID=69181 RepID=A0A8S9GHE2_BRACR|nr:hypothetical protein F2Q70_00019464 [Brassica cretica]
MDERLVELRENAEKWKRLAVEAGREGGSSDKNMEAFVDEILFSEAEEKKEEASKVARERWVHHQELGAGRDAESLAVSTAATSAMTLITDFPTTGMKSNARLS